MSCKKYNAIDIMKLVLAVLVAVIHSGVDKTVISPLLRLAVPLFFIVSSYFFFSKGKNMHSGEEKKAALNKLVKRNLLLYLFWAVVQFPFRIFLRGYHREGLFLGLWYTLRDVLQGNAFTGAWYIVALVIAVLVVYWLSKKIPSVWIVVLMLPAYVLCCFATNYYNMVDANSWICRIADGFYAVTGSYLNNSFPVALFWVSLGKALVDQKSTIKTVVLGGLCVLFAGLLALERYLVLSAGPGFMDDCYFMLIFICPVIFLLVSRSKWTFTSRVRIREYSTVLYVTHGICERFVGYALKILSVHNEVQSVLKVVLTLVAAYLICKLLVYFREKKNIKIFKYAY